MKFFSLVAVELVGKQTFDLSSIRNRFLSRPDARSSDLPCQAPRPANPPLPMLGLKQAPVAQLDRAAASEAVGQKFESSRAHHLQVKSGKWKVESNWASLSHLLSTFHFLL